MTDNPDSPSSGRMLLSHNFALTQSVATENSVHPLNTEQFAEVFTQALNPDSGSNADSNPNGSNQLKCSAIDNPHWIVEVCYDARSYSPAQIGQLCADTLASYRTNRQEKGFHIMALGGVKTTPATGAHPSLQPGEWGVDVVETAEPEAFLEEISWDKLAGAKPAEAIFKIERSV
jgi:hypothetical protein